jgi:hypothetical protein
MAFVPDGVDLRPIRSIASSRRYRTQRQNGHSATMTDSGASLKWRSSNDPCSAGPYPSRAAGPSRSRGMTEVGLGRSSPGSSVWHPTSPGREVPMANRLVGRPAGPRRSTAQGRDNRRSGASRRCGRASFGRCYGQPWRSRWATGASQGPTTGFATRALQESRMGP